MTLDNRFFKVIIGFVMMLFTGIFYAWSLFRLELAPYFQSWSAANVSLNFTVFITCFCSGGIIGGKLISLLGKRKTMYISTSLILIGALLFSFIKPMAPFTALLTVYLSYGGLCGVGAGIAYNIIISSFSTLFPEKSGLVSGILLTGFGFGSLFLGIIIQALSAKLGFFLTFRIFAFLIAAVLLFGTTFLSEDNPAASNSSAESTSKDDYSRAEMLRTPVFWFYMFWVIFMSSGGLLVINNAANIANYFGAFAAFGMIVSLVNGFARIGIGFFFDRYGSNKSILLNTTCALIAGILLLLADISSLTYLMFLGLIFSGISYGSTMTLNASVIKELFGTKYFGLNFSMVTLSGLPASVIGPYISGVLQDYSGGSYRTTFAAMCILAIISIIIFIFFIKSLPPRKNNQ